MTTNLLSVIKQQHKALEELLSVPNDDSPESVARCILSHTKARKAIAAGNRALEQAQGEAFGYVSEHNCEGPHRMQFHKTMSDIYYDNCKSVTPIYTHPQASEPAPSTAGKLQRYEPEIWREDRIRMEPDSLGDWVKFDDVAALLSAPALPVGELTDEQIERALVAWFDDNVIGFENRMRAALAAARTQPELVPMADVDMRALYQQCEKEVAKLEAEGLYTFAAWFPIAIRLAENHHGITKKGADQPER